MATPARPPNVLWIMADQLRYAALSGSGDPNVRTPNLDRLAAEGVRCTRAFSQYPVCTPFRGGLLTGLHATANGTARHGDFLDPHARTAAHAFGDAGYRTSWVGKWHLAPETGAQMVTPDRWIGQDFWVHPALRGGVQDWFGFNLSNNFFRTFIATGDRVEPIALEGYQTDALTDLSLAYLADRPTDEPWFHTISYESPHPGWGGTPRTPLYPVPDAYEDRFDPASIRLRPNVPDAHADAAREQLAGYYRMIENLDDNVGRLLAWLDETGRADSTLVVFFADHGEMGGSHGLRNKEVPYDESIHIPLVWRWPERLPAGTDYPHPLCGLDIFPTSAGLAGVPVPEGLHGVDAGAALTDAPGTPARDGVLVQWNEPRFAFGDHPYRALRTADHTYAVGRDEAFCLLFDHRDDPYEQTNLFRSPGAQAVRAELHARLTAHVDAAEPARPPYLDARAPAAAQT